MTQQTQGSDMELREQLIEALKSVTVKPHQKLNEAMADTLLPVIQADKQRAIDRAVAEKLREIVNFALPDELPAGVDTICASILINTIMERAEQQLSPTTKEGVK